HLLTIHRFLNLAQKKWSHNYSALHRLIHFEQTMMLMAETLGIPNDWIPKHLASLTDKALTESDWAFEGIQAFIDYARNNGVANKFVTSQILANWAQGMEEFDKNEVLTNARRLGRYLKLHKSVGGGIGLIEVGSQNNA